MSKFVAVTEYDIHARFESINARLKKHLKLGRTLVDPDAVQAVRDIVDEEVDRVNLVELVLPSTVVVTTREDAEKVVGADVMEQLFA